MLADPATDTFFFIHYRSQFMIHSDRFVEERTVVVAAPAEGALPGKACFFVDSRRSHPHLFPLFHSTVQGAGRADRHAFHAEIAGIFPGIDHRGAHDRQAVE
jgi:hypothetical protein